MNQVYALVLTLLSFNALAQPAFDGCPTGSENPASQNATMEDDLLAQINAARAANSMGPLIRNADLDRVARYHAEDMAKDNYLDHDSYDRDSANNLVKVSGCNMWTRVKNFYADEHIHPEETIGAGWHIADSTVWAQVGGWMNSGPHSAILLTSTYNEVGVGYYMEAGSDWTHYWVATFGLRAGVGIDAKHTKYNLSSAYPNPFQHTTKFTLRVPNTQDVTIEVMNLLGQRLKVVHDGTLRGNVDHEFTISKDMLDRGRVFFYKVTGDGFQEVRKITLY